MVRGSIYGLNTASCLGKWRQANMNIKVMMFFKKQPKNSFKALGLRENLTNFYPFTLRLAKRLFEQKYRQASRAAASGGAEVFMGHFSLSFVIW